MLPSKVLHNLDITIKDYTLSIWKMSDEAVSEGGKEWRLPWKPDYTMVIILLLLILIPLVN